MTIDGMSQQGAQLPIPCGNSGLIFLIHPQQTHNTPQMVWNREIKLKKKATRQHHHQPISISHGVINRGYSDPSSVATTNQHHH